MSFAVLSKIHCTQSAKYFPRIWEPSVEYSFDISPCASSKISFTFRMVLLAELSAVTWRFAPKLIICRLLFLYDTLFWQVPIICKIKGQGLSFFLNPFVRYDKIL